MAYEPDYLGEYTAMEGTWGNSAPRIYIGSLTLNYLGLGHEDYIHAFGLVPDRELLVTTPEMAAELRDRGVEEIESFKISIDARNGHGARARRLRSYLATDASEYIDLAYKDEVVVTYGKRDRYVTVRVRERGPNHSSQCESVDVASAVRCVWHPESAFVIDDRGVHPKGRVHTHQARADIRRISANSDESQSN